MIQIEMRYNVGMEIAESILFDLITNMFDLR